MWSAIRPSSPSSRRLSAATRIPVAVIAAVLLAVLLAGTALAASPPPVQIYYVPFPEDQVLSALQTLYPSFSTCGDGPAGNQSAVAPVTSFVSISAIAEGTILYYDHWEDGFEVDLSNPTQSTTEIWGDGDPTNGAPPGIPSDVLTGDTVIVLESQVDPANRQAIDFDGGDKIGSTRTIAVTRAAWATGPDTRLAGALEVYPVEKWGLHYEAPVGQDAGLNSQINDLFSYTALAIMATEDNTSVAVDTDADGAADVNQVIDEGESLYVTDLQIGGTVQASAPVQVAMITGEVCENYESRWYTLFPGELWSDSYYNPVSKMPEPSAVLTDTTVFLYNPDPANAITVEYTTMGGAQPSINVAAKSTEFATMPVDAGARFFTTDGSSFQAIAAIDTGNSRNKDADWGLALVPERQLTRQTLIGWGAGRDPTSAVKPDENGSPVWVMPVYTNDTDGTVQICVDYNGDNAPGLDDGNGFYYDVLLTLDEFEIARVYDPDGDQTGMLLYVCDPATGQVPRAKLTAAWGQAPGDASFAQPGLDLGTAAPPAATFGVGKTDDLVNDANGDGLAGPGDTILYTVSIQNSSRVTVEQVILSDTVPLNTSYVLSTTTFDDGGGAEPIPDDGSGTPFPLDEGGVLLGDLPVRGVFTVTFQVLIDDPYLGAEPRVTNIAYVTALGETATAQVQTPVNLLSLEKATNGVDADEPPGVEIGAGEPVTWTYVVAPTGQVTIANVVVTDSVAGVTPVYVSGDANGDNILDPDEQWIFQATGTAIEGQYANVGRATGVTVQGDPVQASDPSHYFGAFLSGIGLDKTPSAAFVQPGEVVTYTYTVANTGNQPLNSVDLTDDACSPVTFAGGDANGNDELDLGEVWTYTCAMPIEYPTRNTATVNALDPRGDTVTDTATAFVEVGRMWLVPIFNFRPRPCPPPDGCPLEGRVKGLGVHLGNSDIFVASREIPGSNPDQLLKVDAFSVEIVGRAPTGAGSQPWGVVVNEQTNRVYVSNYGTGEVVVYDAETLAELARIPVDLDPNDNTPANPGRMAILPDLDTVFIVVRGDSRIAVIQGLNLAQNIPSGGSGPWGIAADPVRNYVYVSHRDSRTFSLLYRDGGEWKAEQGPIFDREDGRQLFGLSYNPNSDPSRPGLLFSSYAKDGKWWVTAWEPNRTTLWGQRDAREVPSGGDLNSPDVGGDGIVVNPATGNVFMANTGDGSITVLGDNGLAYRDQIAVRDDPFPAAVDPGLNTAYIGLRAPGALIKLPDTYGP
jgi:uncharacterized repeat protein (TIGR01451 family)